MDDVINLVSDDEPDDDELTIEVNRLQIAETIQQRKVYGVRRSQWRALKHVWAILRRRQALSTYLPFTRNGNTPDNNVIFW